MRKLTLPREPETEFGWWLYQNMDRCSVSVRQLARDLGVTPTTISYHLHGKRSVSLNMVKRYCDYFDEGDIFYIYEMGLRSIAR